MAAERLVHIEGHALRDFLKTAVKMCTEAYIAMQHCAMAMGFNVTAMPAVRDSQCLSING